jgi:hypothetical protein
MQTGPGGTISAPHQILARNADVFWTEVGGQVALMSARNGCYYGLDPIASAVWRKLERPMAVSRLTAELLEEYSGNAAQIEEDLKKVLGEWLAWHLIIIVSTDSP